MKGILSLGAPPAYSRHPVIVSRMELAHDMSNSPIYVALSKSVWAITLHVPRLVAAETHETRWLAGVCLPVARATTSLVRAVTCSLRASIVSFCCEVSCFAIAAVFSLCSSVISNLYSSLYYSLEIVYFSSCSQLRAYFVWSPH